jgi:hypothetical protein
VVRAEIELYRRNALDQVVGRFAERAGWAADEITGLAKSARSESVRLTALTRIFHPDLINDILRDGLTPCRVGVKLPIPPSKQ